ncbi:cytochrome c oxidase biogenesis protein Cmc1-like protein, putative [Bodo saltans]|uniref:Cytochrome c oxidase biogenesis protein Cmc1-like protein, putative n=1 Tax=Bodo saltans TaxID=75058 RepID=A0A0S4J9I1_BODSA|nr:cytochrome c oxidase biogenesis protein Cmc1-like protein, putative [Bodo saltans]|eukprot:CUG86876.1 cytochrome c oxidase biogenesis protein Cmc1-like protein, putative [Bodo saltans]
MGSKGSKGAEVISGGALAPNLVPDAAISSNVTTPQENADKRKRYANLKSAYVPASEEDKKKNLIQLVYEEDFETIDHMQALRLPPMVVKELKDGLDRESKRRCYDLEKVMARCLQDKMWTAWKCQKERDVYYACARDKHKDGELMNEYRWKYTLGTFHGEILARNNIMKRLWYEHFPDREIPHPWVDGE